MNAAELAIGQPVFLLLGVEVAKIFQRHLNYLRLDHELHHKLYDHFIIGF